MSRKDDVREFLISRRANITPVQAGLPDFGEERRVPGLRREEVARLAGVSLDYYTQLERGNIRGASESVLNAISRALQLDDVEREHLFDLARTIPTTPATRSRSQTKPSVRPSVQRVLDNLAVPAVVVNAQQDLIASNHLGRALFSPHFEADRPNLARFIFLDPRARDFYVDWALARSMTAAMLRLEAGRDPLNSDLTALIGELSTFSPQFRQDWADRDVHEHRTGRKVYRHPEVGEMDITFDVFELPGEPGLSISTFSVEEGSESADELAPLATWAATQPVGGRPTDPAYGGSDRTASRRCQRTTEPSEQAARPAGAARDSRDPVARGEVHRPTPCPSEKASRSATARADSCRLVRPARDGATRPPS